MEPWQPSACLTGSWSTKPGKLSFLLLNNKILELLINAEALTKPILTIRNLLTASWASLRSTWDSKSPNVTQLAGHKLGTLLPKLSSAAVMACFRKHFISQPPSFMTRAFRRERKLCWPSCCFLAWGTVSFYIFLPLLPDSLTKTIFPRKEGNCINWNLLSILSAFEGAFGEGESGGLKAEGICRIKWPLEGRCQGVKGQWTAFGDINLEFPPHKCHQSFHSHPRTSKECQRGGPRQKSVQSTCDAPEKPNFSLFTSKITVTVLSRHKTTRYYTGSKHSWVLSMLQANKIKGWVVVMFYQYIIKSH